MQSDDNSCCNAVDNIFTYEYDIIYNEILKTYHSSDKTSNLGFIYYKDGFSASGIDDDWSVRFRLSDVKRYTSNIKRQTSNVTDCLQDNELVVNGNTAFIENENMRIDYTNNANGMRQDFIIKNKPEGDGKLTLDIYADTKLKMITKDDEIVFKDNNGDKMKYSGLKCWDANGKELHAHFQNNYELRITNYDKDNYKLRITNYAKDNYKLRITNYAKDNYEFRITNYAKDNYELRITNYELEDKSQVQNPKSQIGNSLNSFSIVVNDKDAVYPITIDPLSTLPARIFESNQDTAELGVSVASAGDVNGDGYGDVIMSAPYYDNGQKDEGKVFVYHGSSSGLSVSPNWTAESNQVSALFGWSVSGAGDVNKDGYSDVIIGAPLYDNGETDEGRAYVYYGSASGLSTTPNWITEINQNGADYGYSVCSAGDINNDGYSEVVVGSPYYNNGHTDEGKVFLYKGSSSGLSTTSTWTTEGDQNDGYFGYRLAPAGDINRDGFSDLIVGAYKYDNPELNEGKVFVYHSNGTNLSLTPNWTSDGNQVSAYYGWTIAGGDINGDGYSDIIIGAIQYDNVELDEGRVYAFNGSGSGLSVTPSWVKEINQMSAVFGCWVSLSDINRDGYSDAIIGSYLYDNGQTDEGAAFVYKGSSSGLSAAADWSAESNLQAARMGYCVAGAGDVNGDGFNEVMSGSYSYSNGQTFEGGVYLFNALRVPLKINLTMYIEGLYRSSLTFPMIQDTVTAYLQNSVSPFAVRDSAKAYLSNTGFAQLNFNSTNVNLNTPYYIKLKHRNSLETWSDSGRKFTNTVLNYDFTTSLSKAFGNNMKLVNTSPNRYGIFSGDVNKDGTVDVTDVINVYNDGRIFATGYVVTDINFDNIVDATDVLLVYNNSINVVNVIRP